MNKSTLIKLAKKCMNFAECSTDKGVLVTDGELAVGVEVFQEGEDGEFVPAADGEYLTETSIIKVEGGKVTEIEAIEPAPADPAPEEPVAAAEEPAPADPAPAEPAADEKDAKIAKLEAKITELTNQIAEKDAKIAELEAQIQKPVEEPVDLAKQAQEREAKIAANPALKYFL